MSLLYLCRVATLEDEVKAINQDKPHKVQGSMYQILVQGLSRGESHAEHAEMMVESRSDV